MNLILVYIDPGTGSLLLQMLLGAIVGASLFFKNIKERITLFLKKYKK